jgi:nucleoside-diphosphate-sugar epimerase
MRVFVTGASGWIGSALVPDLLDAGHTVLGLARSDASAEALEAAGAQVHRGSLEDLDSLRAGAQASDGVAHLAFIHDFAQGFERPAAVDRQAIDALGGALEGTGKPLIIASGTLGLVAAGELATEDDGYGDAAAMGHRVANAGATLALAQRGVRSAVVRLPPTVHGDGDHGFLPAWIAIAREKGVSGYIGGGTNRWPAVHRVDAAHAFRLAVESAPAGSVLHAVADAGIETRLIAETIGRHLDLPVEAVAAEDAAGHFGWFAAPLSLGTPASSEKTRELLGWEPTQPGLLDDLEAGHYFREPVAH